jgi:hypothetical protein
VRLELDAILFLDVKKPCYPNSAKTDTLLISKKQIRYACNNPLKQVLKACSRQGLRIFNGTDD